MVGDTFFNNSDTSSMDQLLCYEALTDFREKQQEISDVYSIAGKIRNFMQRVIGAQRPGETRDKYKVRVFVNLIQQNYDTPLNEVFDSQILNARLETELGREIARKHYLKLILNTNGTVPAYWLLYATFCLRDKPDFDMALTCVQKALALDEQDRLAMFFQVAILISTTECFEELETSLNKLISTHPKFSEAHFLFALHYNSLEMEDQVNRSVELAQQFVEDSTDFDHPIHRHLTLWEPISHERDSALKCVMLLAELELVALARTCASFVRHKSDSYHYMMAVLHYKCGEPLASAEHLNLMVEKNDGKWLSLVGHCQHLAGHPEEAITHYVRLSTRITVDAKYTLAYLRCGESYIADGRYAEASDLLYRTCLVARTPVTMTTLGSYLLALGEFSDAEKWLTEAVTMDSENGDLWHFLASTYAKLGQMDMANICQDQAVKWKFAKLEIGSKFDIIIN